jgi:hypothetical protein
MCSRKPVAMAEVSRHCGTFRASIFVRCRYYIMGVGFQENGEMFSTRFTASSYDSHDTPRVHAPQTLQERIPSSNGIHLLHSVP